MHIICFLTLTITLNIFSDIFKLRSSVAYENAVINLVDIDHNEEHYPTLVRE